MFTTNGIQLKSGQTLEADMIVGVRFTSTTIDTGISEILAYGTALKRIVDEQGEKVAMNVDDAVLLIFLVITIIWFVATLIGRAKEISKEDFEKRDNQIHYRH